MKHITWPYYSVCSVSRHCCITNDAHDDRLDFGEKWTILLYIATDVMKQCLSLLIDWYLQIFPFLPQILEQDSVSKIECCIHSYSKYWSANASYDLVNVSIETGFAYLRQSFYVAIYSKVDLCLAKILCDISVFLQKNILAEILMNKSTPSAMLRSCIKMHKIYKSRLNLKYLHSRFQMG